MTKEQIEQAIVIAGKQMLAFVERTGDDKKLFSGKVIVNEHVGSVDFEKDEIKTSVELQCVVFANQPQPQVVFNTTIEVSAATLEDGTFEADTITSFPSEKEIEDAKEQHAAQMKAQQEQMANMDGISPEQMQEMMKAAANGENVMPADELPTSVVEEMIVDEEDVEATDKEADVEATDAK